MKEVRVVDAEYTEVVKENQEAVKSAEPQIFLKGFDTYADAISKFRQKIGAAVKAGVMSEQTGAKIILDNEYNFYQQIVQVEYKPE